MRPGIRRALAMGLGLATGLILFLPLRLVLPGGALSAWWVSGTIWSGQLHRASVGPLALGDLETGWRWPLRLHMRSTGREPLAFVAGRADGDAVRIEQLEGVMPFAASYGLLSLKGVAVRNASFTWGQAGCSEAAGRITMRAAMAMPGSTPELSLGGNLRCRGGNLVARLASPSGLESVEASLFPNLGWQMRLLVRPTNADVAGQLVSAGFRQTPLGYERLVQGEGAR